MLKDSDYRAKARTALSGRWKDVVLATLVYFLVSILVSLPNAFGTVINTNGDNAVLGLVLATCSLILTVLFIPLGTSYSTAFLQLIRGEQKSVRRNMWTIFKGMFTKFLPAVLLIALVVCAAGVITLGIWGIILLFAYSMTDYILIDNPEMGVVEALKTSRKMMRGHKWQLFCLTLSFIGWYLLSMLTLGIGFLWSLPYTHTAYAHFYEDLKAEQSVEVQQQ